MFLYLSTNLSSSLKIWPDTVSFWISKISSYNSDNDIIEKLRTVVNDAGYTDYSTTSSTAEKKEEDKDDVRPYVITPDELGDQLGYDVIELTYYADGVVAEDYNEVMDNVDEVIGVDSLTHFGEYEDDSVCVRNDRLKCDYQILKDNRNYSDVIDEEPPRMV